MKKIAKPHASIRYDVLKKNLLYNQEVLVTYASLLKADAVGLPPVAPVPITPVTDHIEEYHKTNPGAVVSEKLAATVPMFRQSMAAQLKSGQFLHPHGELYQHLNANRAVLDAAASLPETVTGQHAHDLASSSFDKEIGDDDKEALNTAYDNLNPDQKTGVDEGSLFAKLGAVPDYKEAYNKRFGAARDHLLQLMAARAHPDFTKNFQQMTEERKRETDYANKASEELHRQMQTHLGQERDPQSFVGNIASLGEDPMIKHSEKAWQEKHLQMGRRLWTKYREDMKHGKPGATGDPEIDGDPQSLLPANQFWADRGFAGGVRLGSDEKTAEPSYEYLQTALKARDVQRKAYMDAYAGTGKDPKEAFDMLPVIRRFGVSSSVPQNKLEEQFLEKKANEFASKAMKQHRANVDANGDKLRQEKYLAQRLEELQRKPASSFGGNEEKNRQIEELQGALDKEKMKAFLWNPHDAMKNFHEIQVDNDSHFDPYVTDAFRYLHSAGLAHARDDGPETYARLRLRATQNRVLEEEARSRETGVTAARSAVTPPVDLTVGGVAGDSRGDGPGDGPGSVAVPVARPTVAFKPIVPTEAYGVKEITLPSGLVYDPAKPEDYITALFKDAGFSSQLGNAFSDDFLKHFKDKKGVLNMKKMTESFLRALKGAGKESVLQILSKLGATDSEGNRPDTEAFDAMEKSPELSRDTGNHVFANPGSVRKAAMSAENRKGFKVAVTEAIKGGTQVDLVRKILSREEVIPGVTISLDRMFSNPADYHAALASTHSRNYAAFEARVADADTSGTERPSREQMTMTVLQSDLETVFNTYNEDEQKDIAQQILNKLA